MDILQLAREHMNQPAPEEYRPTENAQVVFNYTFAAPAPVYRFNNAKKARKVYEDAVKACCEFGWQGFRADWYAGRVSTKPSTVSNGVLAGAL